jgi:ribonuclease D
MSKAIQAALKAADSATLLTTADQISTARDGWVENGVLALDTEFVRERTYYADIGLIQVSDGQSVWLVDPLADGSQAPVRELLEDRSIVKLVHSPSEDLEVLLHSMGALPDPMVDTQMACAFLGQPLQLAYHAAANWLLGVEVAKDQTRSNWLKRPLRPEQLYYAALDVCLLPEMWRKLGQELLAGGRQGWLEEDCARQLERARTTTPDQESWLRIRGIGRLDGIGLAIIRKLAAWREEQARDRNQPRGFIIPDPVLLSIAREKVADQERLASLEQLHPRARQKYGEQVTALVREVLQSGAALEEFKPLTSRERKSLDRLRTMVNAKAEELGVDPALLASRRELEGLLRLQREAWPDKFSGWRREVMGKELEDILG